MAAIRSACLLVLWLCSALFVGGDARAEGRAEAAQLALHRHARALGGLAQPGRGAVLLEAQLGVGVDLQRHLAQRGGELIDVGGDAEGVEVHGGRAA